MRQPRWLTKEGVLALHDASLARFGGSPGMRDERLLESALARPRNRHAYEGLDDPASLAATYAIALSANHPFVDGNKRAAFLAAGLFLEKNGMFLEADQVSAARVMFAVAAGSLGVDDLGEWIAANSTSIPPGPWAA